MPGSINYTAGGNIIPMSFVSPNFVTPNAIDFQVIQSTGALPIVGIAQMGIFNPPGAGGNQTLAATSGGIIAVFEDESYDEPLLTVNTPVSGGQYLVSDTDGTGKPWIPKSTTQQFIGAFARQSTLPGVGFPQNIRVAPRFLITGTQ